MRKSNLIYIFLISLILFSFSFINWHNEFEFFYFDFITRQADNPADTSISVIAITKEDIKQLRQYPINDDLLAFMINELSTCGPARLVLDIFFSPYGQRENTLLSHAFKQFKENPVICGVPLDYLRENKFDLYKNTLRYANSNIDFSQDGYARPIPSDNNLYPSIINCLTNSPALSKNILLVPPYHQLNKYHTMSFLQALQHLKNKEYDLFRGKTIFIGYHLSGVSPFFKDPVSKNLCSGLNMQVNYFNAVNSRAYIKMAPENIDLLLTLIILIVSGLMAFYFPLKKGLGVTIIFILTLALIHFFLAWHKIIYLMIFYSFIASIIQFIIVSFICSYRNEKKLFKQLSKDKEIIQFIIDQIEGYVILFSGQGKVIYRNRKARDEEPLLMKESRLHDKYEEFMKTGQKRLWWEDEINGLIHRMILIKQPEVSIIKDDNMTLFISLNINESIEMRKKIKEKEHLAAIGQMAAGIAHEIRNPLAGLELTALSIEDMSEDRPELKEYTENMVLAIKSLNRFVSEFLEFSKVTYLEPRETNIKKIIDDSLFMLDFSGKEIEIIKNYDDSPCIINVDPDRLRQVFINLLKNSMQQFDEKGVIEINIHSHVERVKIEVLDNGGGMDKVTLRQAFNPFFTTRAEGTGLGLSICRRLIEAHEGALDLTNEKDGLKAIISLKQERKVQ